MTGKEDLLDRTTLEIYQDFVKECDKGYMHGYELAYNGLGLAGETGEVVERIKKINRRDNNDPTDGDIDYLRLELGDVLWYVANICNNIGITLDDVVETNIDKLNKRHSNEASKKD